MQHKFIILAKLRKDPAVSHPQLTVCQLQVHRTTNTHMKTSAGGYLHKTETPHLTQCGRTDEAWQTNEHKVAFSIKTESIHFNYH